MYPRTTLELGNARSQVENICDALRGAILTLEVEKKSRTEGQSAEADLRAILGLGVLLHELQEKKTCLEQISRSLPSPNQMKQVKRKKTIAEMGTLVFETMEHVKNIQMETYRVAKLNLRSAAAKIKSKKDICLV